MLPRTVPAEQARQRLPDLLDRAERGEWTLVTRRGRPVAAVVPAPEVRVGAAVPSVLELRGSGAGLWGRRAATTIARMREEW